MMARNNQAARVLAIDPSTRGFGFVVLQGVGEILDWGLKVSHDNRERNGLGAVKDLIAHYHPDVVVVEDTTDGHSRRRKRARSTITAIQKIAIQQRVETRTISVAAVQELFGRGARVNKDQIAKIIVNEYLPVLASRLPPPRKVFMSEAESMAMFDAVAFALTYYFISE